MSHRLVVVIVLAVAAAAFAAGAATTASAPAWKFPWVPDKDRAAMHKERSVTELEWRCQGMTFDSNKTKCFFTTVTDCQIVPTVDGLAARISLKSNTQGIPPRGMEQFRNEFPRWLSVNGLPVADKKWSVEVYHNGKPHFSIDMTGKITPAN